MDVWLLFSKGKSGQLSVCLFTSIAAAQLCILSVWHRYELTFGVIGGVRQPTEVEVRLGPPFMEAGKSTRKLYQTSIRPHKNKDQTQPIGYKVFLTEFASDEPVAPSTGNILVTDIFTGADNSRWSDPRFRPVGMAFDRQGRRFVSSDASCENYVLIANAVVGGGIPPSNGTSIDSHSAFPRFTFILFWLKIVVLRRSQQYLISAWSRKIERPRTWLFYRLFCDPPLTSNLSFSAPVTSTFVPKDRLDNSLIYTRIAIFHFSTCSLVLEHPTWRSLPSYFSHFLSLVAQRKMAFTLLNPITKTQLSVSLSLTQATKQEFYDVQQAMFLSSTHLTRTNILSDLPMKTLTISSLRVRSWI